jgi:predicted kinase
MRSRPAILHMFCGKIASGKSTLAIGLSQAHGTVLLSEDHFLSKLYPGEISTVEDYARCAGRPEKPSDRTSFDCSLKTSL